MDEVEFKRRTKQIGLRVIRLVESLPKSDAGRVIRSQVLRSATSIGANYRAACRAVSLADMISKLGDVEEETDETLYWLEMLVEAGMVSETRIKPLMDETSEILRMVVSSIRTLRRRNARPAANPKSKIQNPK